MSLWMAVLLIFLFCAGLILNRGGLLLGGSYRWFLAAALIIGALAALIYAALMRSALPPG